MNPFYKNIALWLAIGIILVFVFDFVSSNRDKNLDEVPFSEFMKKVEQGSIKEISIGMSRGNFPKVSSDG